MSLNFKNLNVASLDYNEIISSLKNFLKAEPTLKDLDYENKASAVNMLLNILATATAYNGIYAQLGYKESFVSTATLLPSLMGLASNSSVLLEAKKSASSTRNIIVSSTELPAYTPFAGLSSRNTDLTFFNIEKVLANSVATITLYCGTEVVQYGDWDFNSQSMVIPLTIDPNTITMTSIDSAGNEIIWEKVDKSNPTANATGYYFTVLNTVNGYLVTANLPESFELTTDYTVYCRGIVSDGSIGNDATIYENTYATFLTEEDPTGGYDELQVETARAKINFSATSQHRCVTLNDYKNAIMSSNIVFVGEENITVANGDEPSTVKIYVVGLTESQITELMAYLAKRTVAGINIIYSL